MYYNVHVGANIIYSLKRIKYIYRMVCSAQTQKRKGNINHNEQNTNYTYMYTRISNIRI